MRVYMEVSAHEWADSFPFTVKQQEDDSLC